jgi:hypothetical protein
MPRLKLGGLPARQATPPNRPQRSSLWIVVSEAKRRQAQPPPRSRSHRPRAARRGLADLGRGHRDRALRASRGWPGCIRHQSSTLRERASWVSGGGVSAGSGAVAGRPRRGNCEQGSSSELPAPPAELIDPGPAIAGPGPAHVGGEPLDVAHAGSRPWLDQQVRSEREPPSTSDVHPSMSIRGPARSSLKMTALFGCIQEVGDEVHALADPG